MNLTLVIILLLLVGVDCFFKSKINKMKERAKSFYQKNFKKDKTWKFIGGDPSEYPGNNNKYREKNNEQWQLYYNCLQEQEKDISIHGIPVPEAILGVEGGSVSFDCKLCLSPREQESLESADWYFGSIDQQYLDLVVYDEHILLTPQNKTLKIYNLQMEHSGQYLCILGDSVTVPYYLTIVNGSSKVKEVHSKGSPAGPYPEQPALIQEHSLVVDTDWSDWSPCSRCKKVGKRHRFGYCIVLYDSDALLKNNKNIVQRAAPKESFWQKLNNILFNPNYKLKFDKKTNKPIIVDKTIRENDIEMLKIFIYGIPCRSHILPYSIANHPKVFDRMDEVMIGYCKVPCAEEKIFEVKGKNGEVIESANNSAGIYSMIQGIPPVAPQVDRSLQYEKSGKKVVLICPGNLNSEEPIEWQINSKTVVPEILHEESGGRIYISLLDRIHIKEAKVSDSHLYSCWQHNELAGTIRLIVEKHRQFNLNHHIMLVGMIIILSTFVYIFLRAFAGRKYATKARE